MRRINVSFLVGILTVSIVLAGATHLVHGFQLKRNAAALLDRARKAEEGGSLSEAAAVLRQYLSLGRGHGEAWRWYARLMDRLHGEDGGRRQEVFLIYEEALRNNPGDRRLELRCIELALDPHLNRTSQARKHLAALLANPRDARERAELEDLRGQAEAKDANFADAAKSFALAIGHDPARVSSYLRLARLQRAELRKDPGEADVLIDRMVRINPTLGAAYLTRFLYKALYQPPANRGDLREALRLAPDDVEVLRVAAAVAHRSGDLATARIHLERGRKLDPSYPAVALALADLELGDRHPERAAAVLRDAVRLRPETMAVFRLAEVLIGQGKADQAGEYLALLRGRGFSRSLVRVLGARRLMVDGKWAEAIGEIEAGLVVLRSAPEMSAQLELMLAECHGRMGSEEQRVAALRRAVDGGVRDESPRLELVQALIGLGDLDEALKILEPMAEQRPELQTDFTALLIRKNLGLPRCARSWGQVEASLRRADRSLGQRPEFDQQLTLLRADLQAAQGNLARAQEIVRARLRETRDLKYRLALADLAQRASPEGTVALAILDEAEKELGASVPLNIARVAHWSRRGGDRAMAEVARLAEFRRGLDSEGRVAYLRRLGQAMMKLDRPAEARKYWNELAELVPSHMPVQLALLDLALEAGDLAEAEDRVERIKQSEGEQGTRWRFARATFLIDRYRGGGANDPIAARADLDEARKLAEQVARRRDGWWGSYLLEAQIAELRPDVETAIEAYRQVIRRGNTQPPVVRRLLALLHQANRIDEIDGLVADLRDRPDASAGLKLASVYEAVRDRDYHQAEALAHEVFPDRSTRHTDHLALGRIYSAIPGKAEDARGEYRRAVQLGPGAPEAWMAYIEFLVRSGKREEAETAVQEAKHSLAARNPGLPLAECCILVGETEEAETFIRAVLEETPSDPAILRTAAGLYLMMGRNDEAGRCLDVLTAPAPGATPGDLAWANRIGATVLPKTGPAVDPDRALTLVEQNPEGKAKRRRADLARIEPNPPTRVELRASLPKAGNPDRAGRSESRGLLKAHGAEDLDQAGVAATQRDRILSHAWETSPPERIATAALALYEAPSVSESQLKQVESWLDEARRRRPDLPFFASKLAAIWIRRGNFEAAEGAYRRLLAGDRENVEALNNLAWLLALRGRCRSEDPGEPLGLINRAIELAGRTASLLDTKAVVLIRANRLDEAVQVLDDARSLDARNASVPLHAALALRGQGKMEESRDAFRTAVKLGWRPGRSDPLERSLIEELRQALGL
jgi:tetratricopeptide (TPR) repeat protein